MGLLDNTSQQAYYQGNNLGNYQFVSLEDIINQFMVIYIGEGKIISKASRIDVAFHAQRALAELSFDTFKSVKSQEIVLPETLQMILPHDYVNYTKISWSDSSGVKHPLYPTKHTSNPTKIEQDGDGNYKFPAAHPVLVNADFSETFALPWVKTDVGLTTGGQPMLGPDDIGITSGGELAFVHHAHNAFSNDKSRIYAAWQEVDVSELNTIELSSKGTTAAAATDVTGGTLKIGLTATYPDTQTMNYASSGSASLNINPPWIQTLSGVDASLEWSIGASGETKNLLDQDAIDVSSYNTVWILITSSVDFSTASTTESGTNSIDDITLTNIETLNVLQTNPTTSTTWDGYKSNTPSENNNDDYEDDVYWPNNGSRYGLEPFHAQINGSFFIDDRLGKIHFSSNVSGKTVILDYISDSLGTDAEMKVHKLAEDAMYKYILCDLISGRANVGRGQLQYYKKDKFAAVRKAKLRL